MVARALWRSEVVLGRRPCTSRRRVLGCSQGATLSASDLHNARATILNPFYNMAYNIIKKKIQTIMRPLCFGFNVIILRIYYRVYQFICCAVFSLYVKLNHMDSANARRCYDWLNQYQKWSRNVEWKLIYVMFFPIKNVCVDSCQLIN